MPRSYAINTNEKRRLRLSAIASSRYYQHYLLDKVFVIVTDDFMIHKVTFLKKDFLHLTGLKVDLKEEEFFEKCVNSHLSTGNISNYQKHNIATLRNKAVILSKLNSFLHADASTNLFLSNLVTNTYTFPVAIRNDKENITVAFKDIDLHARSIRKATSSSSSKETKRILAIFVKDKIDDSVEHLASKVIYIRHVKDILDNTLDLKNEISQNVLNHLEK